MAKNRSEVERMAEVKNITGEFTGAYGINPVNGEEVPIWIADYVLAGYGTGAIMAVPAHDSRDFAFAKHFDIPIIQVVVKEGEEPTDPEDLGRILRFKGRKNDQFWNDQRAWSEKSHYNNN